VGCWAQVEVVRGGQWIEAARAIAGRAHNRLCLQWCNYLSVAPAMPGAHGPKTVKGAQSDPNYVSRLLLDCVPVFHKIITPAYLFAGGGAKIIVTPLFALHLVYF